MVLPWYDAEHIAWPGGKRRGFSLLQSIHPSVYLRERSGGFHAWYGLACPIWSSRWIGFHRSRRCFRRFQRGLGATASADDEVEGDGIEEPEGKIEVFLRVFKEEEKVVAVSQYLRRIGEIPEVVLEDGYDALVAYLKGNLH